MQYVCLFSLIVLVFFSYIQSNKNTTSPIVFINLLFFMITLGVVLHPYELKSDNDTAFSILLLGMFMLNVGYLLPGKHIIGLKSHSSKVDNTIQATSGNVVRTLVLYGMMGVIIFFSISYIIETIALLAKGYSLDMIRLFYFGGSDMLESTTGIRRSALLEYGTTYIYVPCQYIFIGLSAILIGNDKGYFSVKKKRLIVLLTLVNLGVSMLTNGGRGILYQFLIVVTFSYIQRNKDQSIKERKSNRLRRNVLIIIAIIILIWIANIATKNRHVGGEQTSILESVYYYFCGCIPNMQIKIEKFGNSEYTLGLVPICGLVRPFFTFIRMIFKIPIPHGFDIIDGYLIDASTTDFIGGGHKYNAFVTMFYFFYRDFGILGVAFDSLIVGAAFALIYNRTRYRSDLKSYLVYMILIEGISLSFVRYQIMSVGYALAFLYPFLLFKRNYVQEAVQYDSKSLGNAGNI